MAATTIAKATTTTIAQSVAGSDGSGDRTIVIIGVVLALLGIAVTVRPVNHPRWRSVVALCLWTAAAWLVVGQFDLQ
jgi:predicted membrane channel-forming protein YqfA (hemolysin III family)